MKLVRRLSARVVLTAVVSGLVGVVLALGEGREGVRRAIEALTREQYDGAAREACLSAPERWAFRGPSGARIFAYDPATGRSQNPEAPALDPHLAARLPDALSAPDGMVWEDRLGEGGTMSGRMLLRAAPSGPCALLQIEWSSRLQLSIGARVVAWAGSVTALTALLLGLGLVVWPLGRRAERLRKAAERLGIEGGAAALTAAGGDELDAALAGLVAGDARIRADAERLRERGQALERHLADIAHDVRTPLLALQLSIEQAADAAEGEPVRALLASALCDCVYLSGLTENLRMKSLLEEGWAPTPSPEPFDLGAVVERIGSRGRALARRRGIELDHALPDERLEIDGDPVAMERALTNIVDNAVAHGDPGGHVAITLRAAPEGFLLTVLDDGPGVTRDQLPRLAERTFRADAARRRDPRGSGLGLAITAELCARSGWTLAFHPLDPRGLSVTLRGPATVRSEPAEGA